MTGPSSFERRLRTFAAYFNGAGSDTWALQALGLWGLGFRVWGLWGFRALGP